jgi:hypothetical protein
VTLVPAVPWSSPGDADLHVRPHRGFLFARTRAITPPIDLAVAVAALGLPLGPQRKLPPKTPGTEQNIFFAPPPDAQDAAYVASLLALGPSPDPRDRSNAFAQEVNGWHGRLRWKGR